MKILEFIAEHEGNDNQGRVFAEHLGKTKMDESLRQSVIKYLNEGNPFSGFMECWVDCEDGKTLIGGAGYYTDGQWIWAEYHPYYLAKHANFEIAKEFIEEIKKRQFKMPFISKEQKETINNYLLFEVFKGVICNPE